MERRSEGFTPTRGLAPFTPYKYQSAIFLEICAERWLTDKAFLKPVVGGGGGAGRGGGGGGGEE
jgi:hypothetical protein